MDQNSVRSNEVVSIWINLQSQYNISSSKRQNEPESNRAIWPRNRGQQWFQCKRRLNTILSDRFSFCCTVSITMNQSVAKLCSEVLQKVTNKSRLDRCANQQFSVPTVRIGQIHLHCLWVTSLTCCFLSFTTELLFPPGKTPDATLPLTLDTNPNPHCCIQHFKLVGICPKLQLMFPDICTSCSQMLMN